MHTRFGVQTDRAAARDAVNTLFLGNPTTNPALCKVHQAMGLPGTKPILHAEHPVVVGCGVTGEFVLCPPDTHTTSSVIDTAVETNAQFIKVLGKHFRST